MKRPTIKLTKPQRMISQECIRKKKRSLDFRAPGIADKKVAKIKAAFAIAPRRRIPVSVLSKGNHAELTRQGCVAKQNTCGFVGWIRAAYGCRHEYDGDGEYENAGAEKEELESQEDKKGLVDHCCEERTDCGILDSI